MTSAIHHVHAEKGPWNSEGGWEYNAVLMAAVCAIVERTERQRAGRSRRSPPASVARCSPSEPASRRQPERAEPAERVVEVAEQPVPAETRVSESA